MAPAVKTAKASANSWPCASTALETSEVFIAGFRPGRRTSSTPQLACRRRNTSSPKSLSCSDRHAGRFVATEHHHLIDYAGCRFSDVCDLVTILSDTLNNLAVHTLIGKKSHRAAGSIG